MGTLTDAIAFPLHLHSPFRRSYFPSPSMCSTMTTPTPSFAPTTVETAKCDLSIYNKKYDVDVKLLIIVVADIDKKEHKYYDGKKCYNKDCEYKRRYDNDCDDYKKNRKCDKKEHYHERDCKEYYDEYKEYGRDCDYKRKWDNECDEWKKHGKCEKKEHCHDRDCKNYKKYDH